MLEGVHWFRMKFGTFLLVILAGLTTVAGCPPQLDVVFVVDGSGSVGSDNWMIIQDFLVAVINRFTIGFCNVRVGMVTFSGDAEAVWGLTGWQTSNSQNLAVALATIEYPGGNTATSRGLRSARFLLQGSSDRANVDNVIVVITDGKSNTQTSSLVSEATRLKNMARVVVIGVANYDIGELRQIASSNCDIFTVRDFYEMNDNMNARMDQICGCTPGYYRSSICQCEACLVGEFQPSWGQTRCLSCPPGTTTPMGATQCHPLCPRGTRLDSGMCVPCEVGYYQPFENQQTCIACPQGLNTTQRGATSLTECINMCALGFRSTNDRQSCEECEIGEYQPSVPAPEECMSCPNGFSTRRIRSTSLADCEAMCATGQYADGSGMCMPCPIGEYQDMTFQVICLPCPEGTSTRSNGSMGAGDCEDVCEPGYKSNEDGAGCEACPKGSYQPQSFSQQCIQCPDDTTTDGEGSTSPEDCRRSAERTEESMSSGAVAGLVVGLLLLFLLLIGVALLIFLCWRRKKAYARSRTRAEQAYDEIDVVAVPGAFVTGKGKKSSEVYDNRTISGQRNGSNKYTGEPTKTPPVATSTLGYSNPANYDNSPEHASPYDNSAAADVTYDSPVSQSHTYDNLAADDGYDRPPPQRKPKSSALYANA